MCIWSTHGLKMPLKLRPNGSIWDYKFVAPSKPVFNSRWYLYESLVAAGRASSQNCSRMPVKVLPWAGTSEPLNKGVNGIKSGRIIIVVITIRRRRAARFYTLHNSCFINVELAHRPLITYSRDAKSQ